jgi:hypothetical protein
MGRAVLRRRGWVGAGVSRACYICAGKAHGHSRNVCYGKWVHDG